MVRPLIMIIILRNRSIHYSSIVVRRSLRYSAAVIAPPLQRASVGSSVCVCARAVKSLHRTELGNVALESLNLNDYRAQQTLSADLYWRLAVLESWLKWSRAQRFRTAPLTAQTRWTAPRAASSPVPRAPRWRTAACFSWPCCPSSSEPSGPWAAPRTR